VEDLAEAAQLLDAFAAQGSVSLKIPAWWLRRRMMHRPFLENLGLSVDAGGARGIPPVDPRRGAKSR
jgi:hypothetical protein